MSGIEMVSFAANAEEGSPEWRDAEAIRDTVQRVLSRSDYDLDRGTELPSVGWLREVLDWLLMPLEFLLSVTEGMSDGIRWLVLIGLLVVVVALVAHIVWTLTTAFRSPQFGKPDLEAPEDPLQDPADLEADARRQAEAGDYIGACRMLLLAALGWLQTIRSRRFRPGLTNAELLREYAATPVATPLQRLVQTVDLKWYGHELCVVDDYEACRESHECIRRAVQERRHAVGS